MTGGPSTATWPVLCLATLLTAPEGPTPDRKRMWAAILECVFEIPFFGTINSNFLVLFVLLLLADFLKILVADMLKCSPFNILLCFTFYNKNRKRGPYFYYFFKLKLSAHYAFF